MRIFRTRLIAPLAASLMLTAATALAAEGHGGGFRGAMAAPHVEGHFGGGQHFGGADHFSPHQPAFADHRQHFDFHRHDFGHFTPEERAHWGGGRWRHDWHDGRLAWWWIVDGDWYFYPEPIYPYPAYTVPDSAGGWYYCANPPGYYPDVASCDAPWQFIPPDASPP
jgi:hypothetical protein